MGRRREFALTISMAAMVTVPVVIGGIRYYRHALTQFGSLLPLGAWQQLVWHPGITHIGVDAAGNQVATVGAAVQLCPIKLGIWLVPVGGMDVTPGNVTVAQSAPLVLSPGQAISLGGFEGDLLLSEGARGSVAAGGLEPYDFSNGGFAAACAFSLTYVTDNACRFVAESQDVRE